MTETIENTMFSTTYINDEGETSHIELPVLCPKGYGDNHTVRAWIKGMLAGKDDALASQDVMGTEEPTPTPNPFTNYPDEYPEGMTQQMWHEQYAAWSRGYDDWSYRAKPFELGAIGPHDQRKLTLEIKELYDLQTTLKGTYLVFGWAYWSRDDRPEWADNRELDRAIAIGTNTSLMRNQLIAMAGDQTIELPCPTYDFTYEQGGMRISKGAFTKWGSTSDWEGVIESMQQALEECPKGLDIENETVQVNVEVSATVLVEIPMARVVDHDEYIFTGDKDQLHDAIREGVEYGISSYDLSDEVNEQLQYTGVDIDSYEPYDIDTDVSTVSEVS